MHILYLTDGFPYPLLSGRLRQYHFVRALAMRHEVTLYSTVPPTHPPEYAAAFDGVVRDLRWFTSDRLSKSKLRKVPERAQALVREVSDRGVAELVRHAREAHRRNPFDAIINFRVEAPMGRYLPGVPLIVDLCDAMTTLVTTQLALAPRQARPRLRMKLEAVRRVERRLIEDADRVIVSTEQEVQRIQSEHPRSSVPIGVVPNGVDSTYWQRRSRRLGESVVFSGAMNYPPNEAAALTLINSILPRLRRPITPAHLIVAGRDPTARVVAAARLTPGVEVTGYVKDLRPHLERGAVFAAPLSFGAGIQNKLLEAMSMEIPIVTVPSAAAGLAADGRPAPVEVAQTTSDFVDVLEHVMASGNRTPRADLRRYVETHFSWEAATAKLSRELQRGMDSKAGSGR